MLQYLDGLELNLVKVKPLEVFNVLFSAILEKRAGIIVAIEVVLTMFLYHTNMEKETPSI